ncbi:MAG: hypothetical protein ACRC7V_10085 [Lachnospiraceae bacterium]
MRESFEIFQAYQGSGFYSLLFIICLCYLWVVEKEKKIRYLFIYVPAIIQILFFIPLFRMGYQVLDQETYYRILWLLPMTIVIAYSGVKLIGKHTRAGLVLVSIFLVIGGSYVYKNPYITKAENLYHLPQETIEICDMIMPEEGRERIWVVVPDELIHSVRQYTTRIQLAYGREQIVASWKKVVHPIYELMQEDVLDSSALNELMIEYRVNYIVLEVDKETDRALDTIGIKEIGRTTNYMIYQNTNVILP